MIVSRLREPHAEDQLVAVGGAGCADLNVVDDTHARLEDQPFADAVGAGVSAGNQPPAPGYPTPDGNEGVVVASGRAQLEARFGWPIDAVPDGFANNHCIAVEASHRV